MNVLLIGVLIYSFFSFLWIGIVRGDVVFDNPANIGAILFDNESADVILAKFLKQMGYEMEINTYDLMMLKKTKMSGVVSSNDPTELLRRLFLIFEREGKEDGRWEFVLVEKPIKVCKIRFEKS